MFKPFSKFKFGPTGLPSSGGARYTNCFTPLIQLTDGWYGYDFAQSPTGVIVPDRTSGDIFIYAFKFDTVSGDWVIQFGDAGDEQMPNNTSGVIQFDLGGVDNVLIQWNDTNSRYQGTDPATAAAVASYIGGDICFRTVFVPIVLINYSFSELLVKGYNTVITTVQRVMNWIKQ